MHRTRMGNWAGLLLFLWVLPAVALSDPIAGLSYNRPVNDNAGMIPEAHKQVIERVIYAVHQQGGSQIGVVTLKSLEGGSIEDVSIRIADVWKLGNADKDDGVLLVVAQEDRQVRIEVGQGLEGDLPDAFAKRIIDQRIMPMFKQERFGEGVLAGIVGILERTDPTINAETLLNQAGIYNSKRSTSANRPAEEESLAGKIFRLIIMGLILMFLLFTPMGRLILFAMLLSGGRGGYGRGGGMGGGGFRGGGGGFSGGGASGGW